MADLIARSACAGLLPLTHGALTLREETFGAVTALATYKGQGADLSGALQTAHGVMLAGPNRATRAEGALCLWSGLDQMLLLGPEPDPELERYGAITDQSDAWAILRLDGVGCVDVLARLVPLDLRERSFAIGHAARSLLGHLPVIVTRLGAQCFLILGYRSMAGTLVADLDTAMSSVSARATG